MRLKRFKDWHILPEILSISVASVILIDAIILFYFLPLGVSEFPGDSASIWQAIKFADVSLYRAKEDGRNRSVRFEEGMWTEQNY